MFVLLVASESVPGHLCVQTTEDHLQMSGLNVEHVQTVHQWPLVTGSPRMQFNAGLNLSQVQRLVGNQSKLETVFNVFALTMKYS